MIQQTLLYITVFLSGLLIGWAIRNAITYENRLASLLKKPEKLIPLLYETRKTKHVLFDVCIGGLLGLIFVVFTQQLLSASELMPLLKFVVWLLLVVISTLLLYLATYDLLRMEVPSLPLYFLLGLLVLINTIGFIIAGTGSFTLWTGLSINPLSNFAAMAVLGGGVFLIVKATKEKGMGSGDIYLAAIMGISLGLSRSLVAFYITVLTATVAGLIVAARKGRIKNLPIPFVPFIVWGICTTFLLWQFIAPFLRYNFHLQIF